MGKSYGEPKKKSGFSYGCFSQEKPPIAVGGDFLSGFLKIYEE